jgi:hypothetical protein
MQWTGLQFDGLLTSYLCMWWHWWVPWICPAAAAIYHLWVLAGQHAYRLCQICPCSCCR